MEVINTVKRSFIYIFNCYAGSSCCCCSWWALVLYMNWYILNIDAFQKAKHLPFVPISQYFFLPLSFILIVISLYYLCNMWYISYLSLSLLAWSYRLVGSSICLIVACIHNIGLLEFISSYEGIIIHFFFLKENHYTFIYAYLWIQKLLDKN